MSVPKFRKHCQPLQRDVFKGLYQRLFDDDGHVRQQGESAARTALRRYLGANASRRRAWAKYNYNRRLVSCSFDARKRRAIERAEEAFLERFPLGLSAAQQAAERRAIEQALAYTGDDAEAVEIANLVAQRIASLCETYKVVEYCLAQRALALENGLAPRACIPRKPSWMLVFAQLQQRGYKAQIEADLPDESGHVISFI